MKFLIAAVLMSPAAFYLYYINSPSMNGELTSEQKAKMQQVLAGVDEAVADLQRKEMIEQTRELLDNPQTQELLEGESNPEEVSDDAALVDMISRTVERVTATTPDEIRSQAESGDSTAMVVYALDILAGNSDAPQFDEAAKWLQRAADLDNPEAMSALGEFYWQGLGVPKDDSIALSWIQKSAEAGFPGGMFNLGQSYHQGRGVAKDDAMALKWYEKAAEAGVPAAMNSAGVMHFTGAGTLQDRDLALTWFTKAAQGGNPEAMGNLGIIYRDGLGVAQDYNQAIRWFEDAIEQGYGPAMHHLANLYRTGKGVERDMALAIMWFREAANLGQTASMTQLADIYRTGEEGIPKNPLYAEYWTAEAEKGSKVTHDH